MSHTDEQTPIRERWRSRPGGQDDEGTAGALLRAAAEHGPVDHRRLAEIQARLRRSRQARTSRRRPVPRLLRQLVFVAGFVLCGGVLSAAVMHVMRRPLKAPDAAPAPAVEAQKKPGRRPAGKLAPIEAVTPLQTEAPAPVLPPPAPSAPESPSPVPSSPILNRAPASSPRLPSPQRRVALEKPDAVPVVAPEHQVSSPASSPIVTTPPPPAPRPSSWLPPPEMPNLTIPKAAEERPLPAIPPVSILPSRPTLSPAQPESSRLAQQSRWLASAITKLRQEGHPGEALAILDEHQSELSSGALAAEATATRIEALLGLGRNSQALVLLDGQRLSAQGLEREMLVARGELRAEKGRASSAIHDFDLILSLPGRADGIIERALYGRATCRLRQGDDEGARSDFEAYLKAFPQGRFAQGARAALAAPLR